MKAYKFRSSQQIEFIFDILINRRLYCADWTKLNDPMEGMFITHPSALSEQMKSKRVMGIEGVIDAKHRYKVCSLCKTFDNFLLWSHYANGFDGVVIEVELPDDDEYIQKVELRNSKYFEDLQRFETEDEAARAILLSKYRIWGYEKEIRILHFESYYSLEKRPLRVIVGERVSPVFEEALRIICQHFDIRIEKLIIGRKNLRSIPF